MRVFNMKYIFCLSFLISFFSVNAQTKSSFSIKNSTNLPAWYENAERKYTLNDDRIVDYENVKFIGGFDPNKGEIFFINGNEVVFNENQIKVSKVKNLITKTFTSGDIVIKMLWDTSNTTGSYSSGTISLIQKNEVQFKSNFIISGW